MDVVKFGDSIDVISYASGTGTVPGAETDVITIVAPDELNTSVVSSGGNTQGTLYIDFTKGSLTNCTLKIYGSYVGNPSTSEWYQECIETSTSGTVTLFAMDIVLTATMKVEYHFPIGAVRALKITAASTGTATGGILNLSVGMRSN